MQAVKVLHVLNGEYGASGPVWNPLTDFRRGAARRSSIRSPAAAAGGRACASPTSRRSARAAPRSCCPTSGACIGKLRTIPDTVEEFTGYSIDVDFWAWTVPGVDATRKFTNGGKAHVRNVTLPAGISHVIAPRVGGPCRSNRRMRARGSRRTRRDRACRRPPDSRGQHRAGPPTCGGRVKKYWVIEAQRFIRATRASPQVRRGGHVRIMAFARRRAGARRVSHGSSVGGKGGARHGRGARHRARDRAQARRRGLRRRRQLLQQRGRGRIAVRARSARSAGARSRSRAAWACRTASTRCSRSSASTSTASTSSCRTPRAAC